MTATRDRLLDATEDLYKRQGMTGTGIKQILTAAGAPYGSLYHHFPGGKDELTAEAIKRSGKTYGDLVLNALRAPGHLADNLRTTFAALGDLLIETDYADACPIAAVALEVASTNDHLRGTVDVVFTSWIDGLVDVLTTADIPAESARPLALTILSALEGGLMLARTARTPDALLASGDAMAALVEASVSR